MPFPCTSIAEKRKKKDKKGAETETRAAQALDGPAPRCPQGATGAIARPQIDLSGQCRLVEV